MAVLVTGGTGFIGSHTCVELLARGYEVVIIDNLSNSSADVVDRIEKIAGRRPVFYEGDMLDAPFLNGIFDAHEIDSVIHFAGLKAVGESVRIPASYYRTNIGSTLNLIDAMKAHSCTRIVFSSSATVYDASNVSPLKEDALLGASNPYGRTKLFIEQILQDECVANPDFTAILLRYFNPIGAHPSGLIGENPNGIPNNLLPYIVNVALGILPQLNVYGRDYPTVDGTGVRDYIHVCDLARGHIHALEYAATIKGSDAVNLGTGNGTSVLQIVRAFEQENGIRIPYVLTDRRPGDNATTYADPAKANRLLGWQAQYDIHDMVRDSWNFAQVFLKNNR